MDAMNERTRHFKSFSEARKNSDPSTTAADIREFLNAVADIQEPRCYIQEERQEEYQKGQFLVRRKSTSIIEVRKPSLVRRGSAPGKSCLKLKDDEDSGVHWTTNFNSEKTVRFADESGGELVEVMQYEREAFDNLGDDEEFLTKDSDLSNASSLLRTRSSTPPLPLSSSDDLDDLSVSSSVVSSSDDLSLEDESSNRSPSPPLEALLRRKDSLCLAKELLNSKKKKQSSPKHSGRRDSIIVAKYKRMSHYEIDEM